MEKTDKRKRDDRVFLVQLLRSLDVAVNAIEMDDVALRAAGCHVCEDALADGRVPPRGWEKDDVFQDPGVELLRRFAWMWDDFLRSPWADERELVPSDAVGTASARCLGTGDCLDAAVVDAHRGLQDLESIEEDVGAAVFDDVHLVHVVQDLCFAVS